VRYANFQNISWFLDLYRRGLLNLDPPYQRKSVWNQPYKDYFVDTILNNYPAPAVFLFEEISEQGVPNFSVVDGKQRLLTVFEFVEQEKFPVPEEYTIHSLRGKYFQQLPPDVKAEVYRYQFSVEYLPSNDERIINNIFDRINKNVAKLTPQELRHARFDGEFIKTAELLADWIYDFLPKFPQIADRSRKQMKDVEMVAQILLLIEEGPKSYSQDELDVAFGNRDEYWDQKLEAEESFRKVIYYIKDILSTGDGFQLSRTRLKNQTDFYSLIGAIHHLGSEGILPDPSDAAARLLEFMRIVENEELRSQCDPAIKYFDGARSASNDTGPRQTRIDIVKSCIMQEIGLPEEQ
jgi:hypothetical protein